MACALRRRPDGGDILAFRPGVLPIILLFSDAAMYNGPRLASPTYGNPPYDGILGLGNPIAAGRAVPQRSLLE